MMTGRNRDKPAHVQSRKDFYDRLAQTIVIDGITSVGRDAATWYVYVVPARAVVST